MTNRKLLIGALWIGALALVAGCGSKPPVETNPTQTPEVQEDNDVQTQPTAPEREEGPEYVDPNMQYKNVLRPIHFEFNKYRIMPQDKPVLEGIADLMKKNPRWKILVEGNCDERGTEEYNMALGEQRALSTKRYLVSLGVSGDRFQTISYGEERPVDPRSNEEAWAKNRRAEFRVQAPGS